MRHSARSSYRQNPIEFFGRNLKNAYSKTLGHVAPRKFASPSAPVFFVAVPGTKKG